MDSSGFSLEQTPQSGSISSPKEPAGPPPTAELTEDDPYEIKRRMEIAERHGFDYVGGFQDVGIARAQKGLEHYLVDRTGNRVMDLKGGCPSREIVDGIVLIQGGEMVNSKDYLKTHFAIDSGLDTEDDLQFIIDGDYYYFNVRTGKIVGYQSYEVASDFSEGFARVKGDDEKYKFITTEGRNAFPVGKFEPVGDFSQGVAPVRTRDGKVIFIDKNGHQAVSGIYDYALTFKEGFANVKKDGERMFVNKDGEDIFRDVVDWGTVDIMSDFYEGISVIVEKEGNVFFLTTTGEKITPEIPTSRRDQDIIWLIGSGFSEGLIPIGSQGKTYYLNREGKLAIPEGFELARPFSEGIAVVKKNGKYIFIDKVGRQAFPGMFDDAHSFGGSVDMAGVAYVVPKGIQREGGYFQTFGEAYIDHSGKKVFNVPPYDLRLG